MASGNAAIFLPGANGIDIRSGIAHTLLAVRGASEFRGAGTVSKRKLLCDNCLPVIY